MVDRVEQADDLAFHRQRVRDGDLAVEHVANRLGDHGLAVSRGAIDEERVPGGDRGPELVEHSPIEDQVREGHANHVTRDLDRVARGEPGDVGLILVEGHGQRADVMVVLEEHGGAHIPGIGEAVRVRRRAHGRSPDNLAVAFALQSFEGRLDHKKRHTKARGQLGTAQLAGKMQRFRDELQNELAGKTDVFQPLRRRRHGRCEVQHAHGRSRSAADRRLAPGAHARPPAYAGDSTSRALRNASAAWAYSRLPISVTP